MFLTTRKYGRNDERLRGKHFLTKLRVAYDDSTGKGDFVVTLL